MGDQIKETRCPSNPNYCMDKGKPFSGCNGHQRCEEYCSGPVEDFIYYNNTKDTKDTEDKGPYNSGGHCTYCGKRKGAKYHNNQCSVVPPTVTSVLTKRAKISYACLNRMDIAEERIKGS